jgi:pimeloyl-ACP methyl ester carboxylesterase
MATLDSCEVEVIHLFGHCRGAGTILTTLARLARYPIYRRFFHKLGISRVQAKRLLQKIELGVIILNCPLIDMQTIIKDKLGWFKLDWTSPLVRGCVLPLITQYKSNGDSPLKAARHLHRLNLTICIYTEQQDMIVGNSTEAALYALLYGPHTYFCIGNTSGHIHASTQLAEISNALYKRYEAQIEDDTTAILDELQPFIDEAAEQSTFQNATPTPYLRIHEGVSQAPWLATLQECPLTQLVKLFGYNPAIRVYPSDTKVENPQEVTLYAHGYGEYQQAVLPFFQLNSHLLPGTLVSFNFPDVVEHSFMPNLTKSNVAQTGDIRALSLMLKLLDECGLEKIHLFGTSRGGGTIMNTLGRLCTYTTHADFFAKLEISPEQAERILTKIKCGTIVLNCPFIDTHTSAYYWFKEWSNWVLETFIYPWTEHRLNEDQALISAELIKNRDFTILVHFEHNDTVVGNNKDAAFYSAIVGPHTYLVLGNDGGHLHTGKTLGAAVQAFRRIHGGSYYNDPTLLADGETLLAQEELIREDIQGYVEQSYLDWQ